MRMWYRLVLVAVIPVLTTSCARLTAMLERQADADTMPAGTVVVADKAAAEAGPEQALLEAVSLLRDSQPEAAAKVLDALDKDYKPEHVESLRKEIAKQLATRPLNRAEALLERGRFERARELIDELPADYEPKRVAAVRAKIEAGLAAENLDRAEDYAGRDKFDAAQAILAGLPADFESERVQALKTAIAAELAARENAAAARQLTAAEEALARGEPEAAQQALATVPPGYEPERLQAMKARIDRQLANKRTAEAWTAELSDPAAAIDSTALRRAGETRLDVARNLMRKGLFDEAARCIEPLAEYEIFKPDVAALRTEIARARERQALEDGQAEAARRAFNEIEQRLLLPETYAKTVLISRELEPLEIPPGPMEELLNRKIPAMRLTDAGVKELVEQLSEIDGMNIVMDQALTEEQKITVNLRDVPLKELLSYVARNMGVAFHLGENVIWVTESVEPPGTGPKLETRIYKLRKGFVPALDGGGGGGDDTAFGGGSGGGGNAADNELEDALETFLADGPEDATYRIYKTRNLLVVRNSIENLRLIEEIIREFDKEPLQILIEARFITIGQEDLLQLGTNIERLRIERDADQRNELNTLDAISRLTAVSADGPSMTLSGILGNHDYQLVLHALERNDSSRTLSAPRITVLNNHTAKIRRGDVRHYYEEYELGTVDEQTPGGGTTQTNRPVPTGDVQELETGITLMVRPSVGNDGKRILLSLVPEISTFVQWEEFVTARLPHTLESKVSTSVVVDSGETVVLGGMLQKTDIDNVKQVPWFGRLPLLGYLFRYNNRTDSPTHLLIFVTARIIGSTGEFIDYQTTDAAP